MAKAKWEEIEQARRDGMGYALRIAREKGIKGLEDEIRFRNISRVSVAMSSKEYIELRENLGKKISQVVLTLAEITLRDKFGFGKSRLEKFADRLNEKAGCVAEGYTTVGNIGKRNGNVSQVGIRKVAFDKCLINNAMCQKQKKRKC